MAVLKYLICFVILISCGVQEESKPTLNKSNASEKILKKFVFVGDSLVAAYGLKKDQGFVSLIKKEVEANGAAFEIVNAGISGETSSGTMERIDWILSTKPQVVFLCIGSNDGLRGIDAKLYKSNLEQIVKKVLSQNVQLILGGIKLPTNYGEAYRDAMMRVPVDIAQEKGLLFYPFLLEGVAGDSTLNLPDGVHPNEKGHDIIYKNLMIFFKKNGVF